MSEEQADERLNGDEGHGCLNCTIKACEHQRNAPSKEQSNDGGDDVTSAPFPMVSISATTVAAHAGKYSLRATSRTTRFCSSRPRPAQNRGACGERCLHHRPTSRFFRLLLSNVEERRKEYAVQVKGTIDWNLGPAKMKRIHLPEHNITWTPTVELQRTFVRLTKSGDENRAVVKLQARLNGQPAR